VVEFLPGNSADTQDIKPLAHAGKRNRRWVLCSWLFLGFRVAEFSLNQGLVELLPGNNADTQDIKPLTHAVSATGGG
jgi:hypothetical protein